MNEDTKVEPAWLDAQSLRDMRKQVEADLASTMFHDSWGRETVAELARHVVALTGEVERLVGCVAEAERRAESLNVQLNECGKVVAMLKATEDGRVKRLEAALADARDALERIADPTNHHWDPGYTSPVQVAREVLVRLNQESGRGG